MDEYNCISFDVNQPLGSVETNSTGWATLRFGGGGSYYLNINIGTSEIHTLSVLTTLGSTTYGTYDVSSGNSAAKTCIYLSPC